MTGHDQKLSERKAAVLHAVVEGYIATTQPVGSSYVSEAVDMGISAATVRNEMLALEQSGYLSQPHTSAGRVPTDKGYRHFVDSLTDVSGTLGLSERRKVQRFFQNTRNELEQMLTDTSALLANLTAYAALVVGPRHSTTLVRCVQMVELSETVALVLVIYENGAVDKCNVELPRPATKTEMEDVAEQLTRLLASRQLSALNEARHAVAPGTLLACVVDVMEHICGTDEQLYVGGTASLADLFEATETIRSVLGILEKQLVVVSLINDVMERGLTVAIGSETGVAPLAECSLIVAPYEVAGRQVGSIGVLGPTRMNYPQALASVAVVSEQLGDRLSHH